MSISRFLFGLIILCFASAAAIAQPTASGGTLPAGAGAATKTSTKTPTPAKSKNEARRNTPVRKPKAGSTAIATLDGKWWTTGNGFGDSQVVFTQSGNQVSGIIKYADGRTGSIQGTMVGKRLQHTWSNSSGDGGSGWLELSWSNFLGGPWRNQRVRDGSWTLRRIEGKWCFGGNRTRIRSVSHDERGRLSMITEDGSGESGRLEGPWIYLHGEFGDIRGETDYKGTRVNWSTGFFWTWCGR
ncbi:MAG TPA: hypothetical protein VJV03_12015 [Pyrinomonadaceae bacterium]|nr:hypothetical protein [Pyrinomonadaceae bacterium]